MTDKAELIQRIGEAQEQVAKDEADLRRWEELRGKAERNRTMGALGVLAGLIVGIVGLFSTGSLTVVGCGGIVLVAGVLTWVTAMSNQSKAKGLVEMTRDRIAANRRTVAELQAELVA